MEKINIIVTFKYLNFFLDNFKYICILEFAANNSELDLVGNFRSSGFFKLYRSFENIEKIRILVGLSLDRQSFQIIEKANNLDFETHAKVKEILAM